MAERGTDPRWAVAARAIWTGLGISAAAGAIGGTFAFPLFGTIYGLVVGLGAGVVPIALATAALTWAARPDVTAEAYAARATRIVVVLGAAVGVLGTGIVLSVFDAPVGADAQFQGPALLGVVAGVGLLALASRRLTVLPEPPFPGRTSLVVAATLLLLGLVVTMEVVVPAQLGVDARGKRAAAHLRDQVRKDTGFHPEDPYTHSGGTRCAGGKRAYFSSVSGPIGLGQISAQLDAAKAGLTRRGFSVVEGEDEVREWVYGRKADREVTVTVDEEAQPSPDSVTIEVAAKVNCPTGPPA